MLEKNGKALDFFPGEVSTDRITAIQVLSLSCLKLFHPSIFIWKHNIVLHFFFIQDAYWSMASALSEADGIDYTDPEEVQRLCIFI